MYKYTQVKLQVFTRNSILSIWVTKVWTANNKEIQQNQKQLNECPTNMQLRQKKTYDKNILQYKQYSISQVYINLGVENYITRLRLFYR